MIICWIFTLFSVGKNGKDIVGRAANFLDGEQYVVIAVLATSYTYSRHLCCKPDIYPD